MGRGGQAAGGKSFDDFIANYVDGREPYPLERRSFRWRGSKVTADTILEPRIGLASALDSRLAGW